MFLMMTLMALTIAMQAIATLLLTLCIVAIIFYLRLYTIKTPT
jgi:cbb3-type cytochrome oxidase subunit 3